MDALPVQYVTSADGYKIAYTVTGEGRPLIVRSGGFDSALSTARFHPEWLAALASRFRVIYADMRGSGLSQRGLKDDVSLADFDRDVEALAELFTGQRLVFLARGMQGHPIIRFADRHPDRVRAIVWFTAAMRGAEWPLVQFATVSRENWIVAMDAMAAGSLSRAPRREQAETYARNLDLADLKIAVRVFTPSSVEAELGRLAAPLLVVHPREYVQLPPTVSMQVAACAPNARFVLLESAGMYDLQEVAAIDDFVASLPPEVPAQPKLDVDHALSERELEVLRLISAGKSNPQIAEELVISLNTVQRHVSNILAKTGAANRTEAAGYARDRGLA